MRNLFRYEYRAWTCIEIGVLTWLDTSVDIKLDTATNEKIKKQQGKPQVQKAEGRLSICTYYALSRLSRLGLLLP